MKYGLRVYYWNPNGTNDIEVINRETKEVIEVLPEALFGVHVPRKSILYANPTKVLKHIAVSPVSDGSETIEILTKYFGVLK